MKQEEKLRLVELLLEAEQLAGQYTGGYSNRFLSAEEFHCALKQSIQAFIAGDDSQIDNFWHWFAPTTSWDDFIKKDGMELGNKIYDMVLKIQKNG